MAFGSFLNVVIARLPEGLSVVSPRSRCPKCGHQLPWYENIPVVSWVMLRGKCSGCHTPISPRYILVELLTGCLFMAALARYGWNWPLVIALTFVCLLIPLVFIDAEHWVLPFELTLPGIAVGLLLHVPLGLDAVVGACLGAVVGFVIFRAMEFLGWLYAGTEALGAGDKYLLAMIGATLGWKPILGVVTLSALQGSVFGIYQMLRTGRAGPASPPPPQPPPPAPTDVVEPTTVAEASSAPTDDLEDQGRDPWTPAFLQPGLPVWKRLVLVPYAVFLQDIPDPPPVDEATGEEPEWVPPSNSLPFGPWIGLAALEVMLAGPALAHLLAQTPFSLVGELLLN